MKNLLLRHCQAAIGKGRHTYNCWRGKLIWSLKKDRWNCINKFPTLRSLIGKRSYLQLIPAGIFLFVKKNGNILLRKHDDSFLEYDVRKNKYTEFRSTRIPYFGILKTLYVESLVSLKISWD